MNQEQRLLASSRVALAAFLHDLGKFAERARLDADSETLATHQQLYCPRQEAGGRVWHTHKHAAYTALAFDIIERHAPDLVGDDLFPFADWRSREADDSLVNAAARHHLPGTFLQWIIATADRVASGFEREDFDAYNRAEEGTATGKNHYQARQLTLFEQIRIDSQRERVTPASLEYRYPLQPLSPKSIFPEAREACEPGDDRTAQDQYRTLWNGFLEALEQIPGASRRQLPLWLDHFDTLWQTFSHAIPSATAFNARPEVSLYDHSKATAALATALWRYHHDLGHDPKASARAMRTRSDWDERKLLLIQGDFFGIQAFIFTQGGDSNKKAAKLLRGRSFYVSLVTECAALALLDALALPSTSQIINAAGKFLIVAPNTDETAAAARTIRQRFDDWFLSHSYGQSGLGIAWQSACCNDFVSSGRNDRFQQLMTQLHRKLERSKFNHFDLCGEHPPEPVFDGYLDSFAKPDGVCAVNDKAPAAVGKQVSSLAQDQIDIGDWLVKHERLLISRDKLQEPRTLNIPLFGYWIHFTGGEERSGRFGAQVGNGNIRRIFDFSPPAADGTAPLWHGCARRNISGYVPLFTELNEWDADKYGKLDKEALEFDREPGSLKTLNHLACEDTQPDERGNGWIGIEALSTLKGDIDDLGAIFQQGLERPTFAKMAALSRQVNNFFSVYLPWLCRTRFNNSYTVFAGGDDFFLIGPWKSQIELARTLRERFQKYVAQNEEIHFSAGISTTKPGLPIDQIAHFGEEALEQAKAHGAPERKKNAVTCFGQSLKWDDFDKLWNEALRRLEAHGEDHDLSTGYVYGLVRLTDMAADASKPENALWRSQLCYRTERMVLSDRGMDAERKRRAYTELVTDIGKRGIERYKAAYKIALYTYLYQHRD